MIFYKQFLVVLLLSFSFKSAIARDLFGPPGPSPWFNDHIELEPFDLPPGVSIVLNSQGFIEIKNTSSTVLYLTGLSFWGYLRNSDESPVTLPPGRGLLHKAVNGQVYNWGIEDYDEIEQEDQYNWGIDDRDSILLNAFGNQVRSSEGSVVDLEPVNQFDGNRPENVKIPDPQKVFLPIIYGNENIDVPIIISYTLNTKYQSDDSRIREARLLGMWQVLFISIICAVSLSPIIVSAISTVKRLAKK